MGIVQQLPLSVVAIFSHFVERWLGGSFAILLCAAGLRELQMCHQKRWVMLVCNPLFLLIQLQFVKLLRQCQSPFQRLKSVDFQVVMVCKPYHLAV